MKRTILFLLCAILTAPASADEHGEKRGSRQPTQTSDASNVPAHSFDVILARPTSNSITASVLCYEKMQGFIAYGTRTGQLTNATPRQTFKKAEPVEIILTSLQPDTRYFYQVRFTTTNSAEFTFHTARPPGSTFTFTIQADSHLDSGTSPEIYLRSLTNALKSRPDFHIDLGDTFMTDKYPEYHVAAPQYVAQRYYFGTVASAAPLFLVLGNHDGESRRFIDGTATNMTIWANAMRKKYFPNPQPNEFYRGNTNLDPFAGRLENYYSWEWGDALFVVLDPFWFTPRQRGSKDNWYRTLGREQYDWLKRTLETSRSKFKFIFIHHLVGGAGRDSRGGAEAAAFYEWGGRGANGEKEFSAQRPGWPMPIHELLVKNKVNIVFHGHDHLYAKQDLDGIVYQEVPQPGHVHGSTNSAESYGYKQGKILASPGVICVTISPDTARVEYRKTVGGHESEVADTYSIH